MKVYTQAFTQLSGLTPIFPLRSEVDKQQGPSLTEGLTLDIPGEVLQCCLQNANERVNLDNLLRWLVCPCLFRIHLCLFRNKHR